MNEEILKELNVGELRAGFLEYTRLAFRMLPEIERPRILVFELELRVR